MAVVGVDVVVIMVVIVKEEVVVVDIEEMMLFVLKVMIIVRWLWGDGWYYGCRWLLKKGLLKNDLWFMGKKNWNK